MMKGALIAESLRLGVPLRDVPIVFRQIYRFSPPGVSPDQPATWTVIDFEVADEDADGLAARLIEVLDQPGWYCDFRSATEHVVAFPGKSFRYRVGDHAARAEAQAYGRSMGVPDAQLDWRE